MTREFRQELADIIRKLRCADQLMHARAGVSDGGDHSKPIARQACIIAELKAQEPRPGDFLDLRTDGSLREAAGQQREQVQVTSSRLVSAVQL